MVILDSSKLIEYYKAYYVYIYLCSLDHFDGTCDIYIFCGGFLYFVAPFYDGRINEISNVLICLPV